MKKISKRISVRKRKKIMILCGFVLLCVLILCGIYFGYLHYTINKVDQNVISKGVYVGDVDTSEMTEKEAIHAVEKMITEYQTVEMTMAVDKKEAIATLEELGFGAKNIEQLVTQALNYGKTGNVWKKYRDIKKLNKVKKVIQPTYIVDKDKATAIIQERCLSLTVPAINATIVRQEGAFVVAEEQEGETLDIKSSVQKIETFLNSNWHGKSGKIKMASAVETPKITKEDLAKVTDLLGSYSTYYGSGGGRVQNVETSARLINGNVIMPGQEYSTNAAMEPYTVENGYTEAGSFENGAVVQSMGGGICQVSTTLYNAVLLAELAITQRSPHSMLVTYVEPSMDAAIAGDYLDLKFMNNTEAPIYLESILGDGTITFNVYGKETRDKARTVVYTSEIVERKEPQGKEFKANPEDTLGSFTTVSGAYTGITAKLWKTVNENGTQVSHEAVNSSIYESVKPLIKVGIQTDNAQAKATVEEAIKSQDEATINAAIVKANEIIAEANKVSTEDDKTKIPN